MAERIKTRQELANDRRRQEYFKRRRTVQKLDRSPVALQLDRMATPAVWRQLETYLLELLNMARDASSPAMYTAARGAWECYAEAIGRGDQLSLFE